MERFSIQFKKLSFYFALFFVLNLVFFLFSRNEMVENGVYYRYFQSIIHDGDFNIFNQFSDGLDKWMVTTTYNHPDYHSPFISALLLAPFSFFKLFLPVHLAVENVLGFQYFFTLSLVVLIILEGYSLVLRSDDKKFKTIFCLLFFTTAAFWQTFVDSTEMSIVCLAFSLILFFELYKILLNEDHSTLVLAMALGIFSLIKADGLFYAMVIPPFFLLRGNFKKCLLIALFLVLSQGQFYLMNFIRLGEFSIHNPVISTNYFYLVSNLIGPNGLFLKNPLMFFVILTMIHQTFYSEHRNDRQIIGIGLLIIILKCMALSFNISPVENELSSRHLITEMPFMAYALLLIFRRRMKLLMSIFLIFLFVNFYDLYGYFLTDRTTSNYNYYFTRLLPWDLAKNNVHLLLDFFKNNNLFIKTNLMLVGTYSFLSALFLSFLLVLQSLTPSSFRRGMLCYLLGIIILYGGSNYFLNPSNTEKMKQEGLFLKSVVAKGNAIYYDEVLDMINQVESSANRYGIPSREEVQLFQKNYLESVVNNIVYDPIDFKEGLKKNKIRKSFWQMKYP